MTINNEASEATIGTVGVLAINLSADDITPVVLENLLNFAELSRSRIAQAICDKFLGLPFSLVAP